MKELDFLPRSYHQRLSRRAQTRRNILMCLVLFTAMLSLHGLNLTRIRAAQAALNELHNGSGGWRSARSQFAELESRKALCRRRLDLINRLEDAAPPDAVMGEATRLLAEPMAMTGFSLDATATDKTAAAGSIPTRVRIAAVAATDVEVGMFLGKLSACPLFSDVTLSFSRDAHNTGRKMREFEVKFTLRPVENTP
jgi:hypothetical protein